MAPRAAPLGVEVQFRNLPLPRLSSVLRQLARLQSRPVNIKHVLVIYSNDRLEPANVEVDSGFREALAESDPSALVDAEFLDMPGFDEEAYHSALVTFLRTKYSRKVPDVIVAAGDEAIDFMLRDRSKLFPLVPIVHEFVAKWFLRRREPPLPADVVGVPVDYDFAATIEQALQWRQQARRLVLVTGASPSDQLVEAELRNVVSRFKDRVKIEFLTGLPTSAVLKRLGQLGDDAVVFTPGYYQDGEGRSYTPRESARIMASAATAPVFGPFNTFMGTGIVGGVMPSFRDMGLQAGVALGRLLKGEAVASLNLPEVMPGTLNVDWRQLSRWGIPASAVPSGAIVQFREPSLWERYPHELIIITIAFLLLIGLVTGLIIERQRRRRAESAEAKNRSDVIRAMRLAVAGELSGSIAHEIAQPLGAILNNVDAADLVLESGGDNRDELRAIHSDIRRDNQRASEVIRRLRSLFAMAEHDVTIEYIVDLIVEAQTIRTCLTAAELDPDRTPQGYCIPGRRHVAAGSIALQKARQRATEILRILPGSSLVVAPSDAELERPELSEALEESFGGGGYTALQRAALLSLAWDHIASGLDGRESAFELHANGGMLAWRGRLRRSFERYNELANGVLRNLRVEMPPIDVSNIGTMPVARRRPVAPPPGT